MIALLNRRPGWSFLGLAAAVYLASFAIVSSIAFQRNAGALSTAIALDLTLTVPLAYYVLVVRMKRVPWRTLVPIFVLSAAAAGALLPRKPRYLEAVGPIALIGEGVLVTWIVGRIIEIRAKLRDSAAAQFEDLFPRAARDALGDFAPVRAFAYELTVLYFALFSWRRVRPSAATTFTSHREIGWAAILTAFFLAIAAESIALHVLVMQWSATAAWVLTALSVYSVVWLVGDYRALILRPIAFTERGLRVSVGMRFDGEIPYSHVTAVRDWDAQRDAALPSAAVFGSPTVVLELAREHTFDTFFGMRKKASAIALRPDGKPAFLRELRERILR